VSATGRCCSSNKRIILCRLCSAANVRSQHLINSFDCFSVSRRFFYSIRGNDRSLRAHSNHNPGITVPVLSWFLDFVCRLSPNVITITNTNVINAIIINSVWKNVKCGFERQVCIVRHRLSPFCEISCRTAVCIRKAGSSHSRSKSTPWHYPGTSSFHFRKIYFDL
jgi:hypothetical protein